MRTLVASDLHFEFHRDAGASFVAGMPDADCLICAGDLANADLLQKSVRLLCAKYPTVLFVAGNHEFYRSSIGHVRRKLDRLDGEIENLHYLHNKVVEVNGQRFAGTTMWFRKKPGIESKHHYLGDFHHIADAATKVYEENEEALAFLQREVDEETVVVTHHMPSDVCVHERYEGSPLNAFFVCDMEALIQERMPPVWIHGHTHSSVDTMFGKTRIVCNPFGYSGREINPEYVEDFFLDR